MGVRFGDLDEDSRKFADHVQNTFTKKLYNIKRKEEAELPERWDAMPPSDKSLENMTCGELQWTAIERGVPLKKSKRALLERLQEEESLEAAVTACAAVKQALATGL